MKEALQSSAKVNASLIWNSKNKNDLNGHIESIKISLAYKLLTK